MKNKYFIWSSVFALYPILLGFVFNDTQIGFLYENIRNAKIVNLVMDIIINSVYVSVILGIILGVICLFKSKFQNIYVWIPIALCLLFTLSIIVGLF
jgi:hypothetical protein